MFARWRARKHNAQGLGLADQGRSSEAEQCYRRAIAADPGWSVPHYNLGLLCKYARRWRESLDANRVASDLSPSDQAAAWNLGIAATALGDWSTARAAWQRFGLALPEGEGPIFANFGLTPIRLDPDDRGEVVWAHRICPARARIASIPLPESGHRYGDLVLHDGAAVGERSLGDQKVPVFNALALLAPSSYSTFVLWAPGARSEHVESLCALAHELGCSAEDWSSSVRHICRTCSMGSPGPHEHDEAQSDAAVQPALAARDADEALRIATLWSEREQLGPVATRLLLGPPAPDREG